ncbi:MAG: SDR family NAD(P)-dependent oxidoreductase [Streptosporangiales bacterium]
MSPGAGLDLGATVTVVTGAGGGIGSAIARSFAAAGAAVVAQYRGSRTAAETLVESIQRAGGRATSVRADITREDECEDMVATATREFGRLDALVNNAGVQPVQDLAAMTAEQWREVVDTNLTGTFLATQAAARVMREAGGGSITHIASIEGSHPAWSHAHYTASKAAVLAHAKSAALEYGRDAIRVNAVSPGLVDNGSLRTGWPEGVERWLHAAPLGRLGAGADIGNACVFLASPLASWITGHDLVVDGGASVHPTW